MAVGTVVIVNLEETTIFYRSFILKFLGLEDEARNVSITYYIKYFSLWFETIDCILKLLGLERILNKSEIIAISADEQFHNKGAPSSKVFRYLSGPKRSLL